MSGTIACPICSSMSSRTTDSRSSYGCVRRRRICSNGHRYRTQETVAGKEGEQLALISLANVSPAMREAIRTLVAGLSDRDGAEGGDANAAPVPQDRHARAEGIAQGDPQ